MTSSDVPRKRDAAATRASILASARHAFATFGYDGAGVRDIAQQVGVTAMLVNRYFGSKEQLFAEVVATTLAEPQILRDDVLASRERGRDLASALIERTAGDVSRLDGFLILLKSASNERAAAICREQVEEHHQRTLASSLGGESAELRAGVALALIAGFQFMRQMLGMQALAEASPEALAAILAPAFDAILAPR
ncbi:TetR family transcriptional regulator [Luteibacter sp. 3190]|uniref:TetR/AcrR family transcriptional regulator n=1 Tax=Luteibacter sp. 3190 TaxID=2817736 RepID=UPI002867995D|nr:TetR family transcriptional regulator [Luteibacter sp. 3190]MDR6937351.1 AcrR family transcriptional regulator [Luteibacter sp. 3190]